MLRLVTDVNDLELLVVLHFQSVAKFYFVASAVAIDLGDDSTREGGLDMSLDQIGDESCGYC